MGAESAAGAPLNHVGKYRIESILGQGAFGTTYLGRNLVTGARVAVKVFASGEPDALQRRASEIKALSSVQHPNIQRLIESGAADGRPYIAYEWIEGATLEEVLRRGPLPLACALSAAAAIGEALRFAHAHGMIHRDLKPANVLIPGWPATPRFNEAVLLDFGVAGELDPRTRVTVSGMTFGTPVYMSPEQVLGEPQTTATDVYGLGLLLFEMIAGSRMRGGDDPIAIFTAILKDEPSAPDWPMPPAVAELIRACVRRDPAQRPPIEEALAKLDAIRRSSVEQAGHPAASSPPAPASSPPAPALRRAPKLVAFAIALVVLILVAATAMLTFSPRRTATRTAPPTKAAPAPSPEASPAPARSPGQTPSSNPVWTLLAGVALAAGGVGAGYWIRGLLTRSPSDLRAAALGLALDAGKRLDVTATIAMQVTDLVGRLRDLDERILAGTVALMLDEYQKATEAKDRQSALMNVVSLAEKLGQRLSPWYVRYKDAIGSAVAAAGAVSGLLTAYNGFHTGHR
ncbi:MAG TPA: serine/threonine-protein kinase [Bryobacteraceae bacterium]|nr:serine/threonine-protein kinase [Bryobacteraceae bacterium]